MTDTFTRESLDAYAQKPQTQVADSVPPVEGKVSAPQAAVTPATDEATPSGDEGTPVDQTETGDGTSDVEADSSTAVVEPGNESDTETETDGAPAVEAAASHQAPKKGSAAARIQELLDLTDGYKQFGKLKESQVTELQAEIARLKSGGTPDSRTGTTTAPPTAAHTRMPRLDDPGIDFDTDKLQEATDKWTRATSKESAREALREAADQSEQQRIATALQTKLTTYSESHPDFETVGLKNPVLIANQLSKEASLVLVKSPFSAEIIHYFGKDPALAVSTAKMNSTDQLVVMGEVIAQIKAEAKKSSGKPNTPVAPAQVAKQKSLTNAPQPPTAVKGAGRANVRDETDTSISMDDFARKHREGKQSARLERQRIQRGK